MTAQTSIKSSSRSRPTDSVFRFEEQLAKIFSYQKAAPVETIEIANALGLNVYYVDWQDDMSGMIKADDALGGSSGYAIFVNQNHHPNRRRFTIAHEIAHFVRHKELIGNGIFDDALYRSGLPSKIEVEANKMAADILMPWHLIRREQANGLSSVEDLARKFKVSKSAMSIRLGVPYEN